jgi:hypothetical protein
LKEEDRREGKKAREGEGGGKARDGREGMRKGEEGGEGRELRGRSS